MAGAVTRIEPLMWLWLALQSVPPRVGGEGYAAMVDIIAALLLHISAWVEGCCCHYEVPEPLLT